MDSPANGFLKIEVAAGEQRIAAEPRLADQNCPFKQVADGRLDLIPADAGHGLGKEVVGDRNAAPITEQLDDGCRLGQLDVKGTGEDRYEAAWVGSLASPVNISLRRPGADSNWRVAIEEWERLPGDPADLGNPRGGPVWEQRLVYADNIGL